MSDIREGTIVRFVGQWQRHTVLTIEDGMAKLRPAGGGPDIDAAIGALVVVETFAPQGTTTPVARPTTRVYLTNEDLDLLFDVLTNEASRRLASEVAPSADHPLQLMRSLYFASRSGG